MFDVSRFFTVLLSIHPICHGSVAVSDCFYIQWKVAEYRKKYTIRTSRVNWDPWIQQLKDFVLFLSPGQGYIFFSARLWPGSHQALVALQQHHTTNGWPRGDTVSCLGARKRVDVTFGFCSFDTLINPYSINKWKFTYKKTHPTLSILILWFANQNKKSTCD